MLSSLRSMKNAFAPINRIPSELLRLIPSHWEHTHMEQDSIMMTHVCRGWRDILTSCPSLWTHLDCKDVDKTRVYIERSRSLPLEISLRQSKRIAYCLDALLLAFPHIDRLSSLTICVPSTTPSVLLNRIPFLDPDHHDFKIPNTIPPKHFSPLRKLSLSGVITRLPWRNLSNLTVFMFRHVSGEVGPLSMTQLLDFFESAPLLSKIVLCGSTPTSSGVPPG